MRCAGTRTVTATAITAGPLHKGFPNALLGMGCPTSGCVGYELSGDLDFDTNASGDADSGDDYWNSGHGWVPIGTGTLHYSAVFEGNGHTISNLFIDSDRNRQSLATGYARKDQWSSHRCPGRVRPSGAVRGTRRGRRDPQRRPRRCQHRPQLHVLLEPVVPLRGRVRERSGGSERRHCQPQLGDRRGVQHHHRWRS